MEPYKIYDFEDEKAWLKGRLNGIGGSDASAVVGKNPYKTNIELFEEKTGRRIAPDISEKPYVIYGKEAEQFIRELFRLDYPQYQVTHHEFRILQSLEYPFMQASLDGELVDQDGRKGILEIKTTNILQSMQYEKWKDRIPDNYYIQVLHYLLVTGYEFVVLRAHLRSNWGTDVRTQVKHYFIERAEGHRIQQQSTMDACYAARDRGADVVKQWDAALDAATRESHQMLDGQIRELDDKFSNGLMYPGDPSGSAAEVINCRCILLQRARWKLDSKELDRLEKRASFYGLNKEQEFDDFREKYLKAVETKEEGAYSTTVKRIGTSEVNLEYIKSEAFRKKFNKITENTAINDSLRNYATAMLLHRNGTDGEDLYIMDSKGKLLLREISGKNELGVTVSAEDSEMLRKKNGVVGIHNHPTNIPPTGSDFVAAGYRKYIFGIVVTHSGRVYKYKVGNKPFLPRILDERIDKYINTPYNLDVEEAHTRALNELAKEYGTYPGI